jgi:8-oxo-dGTP pyrophosphatase MutT (NUDIX family)
MSDPVRTVSCAIIVGTCGRLLLQQRDDIPGIIHPGLIGLFGGHREAGEAPEECLQRELEEEIGQRFPRERLEPLLSLRATFGTPDASYDMSLFVVRNVALDTLRVMEGQPLIAERAALPSLYARMTPATAFAVRQFVMNEARPADARRQAEGAQQQ